MTSDDSKAPGPQSLSFGMGMSYQITPQASTPTPFDPDAAFEDALKKVEVNNLAEAFELCRKVVAANPDHDRAWHMYGFLLLQKGEAQAALEALEKSAALGSNNPLMFMHLGIARASASNTEGAIEAFEKSVAGEPALFPAHFNLGLAFSTAKRFDEAEAAFSETVKRAPDHADAWAELAQVRTVLQRDVGEVREALDRALALNPEHISALNQKALLLALQGERDEAIALMEKAVARAPKLAELHVNLGDLLLMYNTQEAVAAYREAVRLNERFPDARAKLARALERIKQIEDARALAQSELADNPGSFVARLTLARCDLRTKSFAYAREKLNALLQEDLGAERYANVQKTLAVVLDQQGEHDKAFEAARQANARQLADKPVTDEAQSQVYEPIARNLESHTADLVRTWPRTVMSEHPDPIFFVGFPRSGTTLMEQILSVHPRFVSSDENDWVRKTYETLSEDLRADLGALTPEQIEGLRGTYWKLVEARCGETPSDLRRIDKMPLNILHLGFIRRVFPAAKVLVALRDPRDCVISGFMQPFHRTAQMDQFLQLESAARFYAKTMELWLKDKDVLGLDVLEYRYEDLVAQPRTALEGILDFLGEPWDENVLHHDTLMTAEKAIATPSMRDVSQSIYTRASGRWRNFENELAPVLETLSPYIQRFGYQ